jgi:hypothetical protein
MNDRLLIIQEKRLAYKQIISKNYGNAALCSQLRRDIEKLDAEEKALDKEITRHNAREGASE